MVKKMGYELVKPDQNTIGFNSKYLSSVMSADLVIDVGAANGTYQLYEAFPKAKFVLIEPLLEENQNSIDEIASKYDCEVIGKALGEKEGKTEIQFSKERLQKASLFERTSLTKDQNSVVKKEIEITTLDSIFGNESLDNKSVLLKIDTEGSELSTLKGGINCLKHIDFVVAEVSLAKRFEESYEFEELILFMKEHGFKVFSFLSMSFSSQEPRQRFTDILFCRAN